MVRSALLLVYGCLAGHVSAFVATPSLTEKAAKADVIVRGVVLDIIPLATAAKDSRGNDSGKITDPAFSGPNSVAIVRIITLIKGEISPGGGVIFVPCGYDFDESPAELTKTREYVLFLESMGHHYYHPTTASSAHQVKMDRVATSGYGGDDDFSPDADPGATTPFADFSNKLHETPAAAKPATENEAPPH